MSSRWRLLIDDPLDGALNMARDRAIQLARERGESAPTLRLYRWSAPTVTLGRFQETSGVDLDECRRVGVDVVRRSTGGRGVLHDDELTYSVIASTEDGVPRGVAASYRYLSQALACAYRNLGVDAQITHADHVAAASSACYLATTRADLSLGPAKLAGSAQVWHGSTVLQHGSFTRSRDVKRESRVFRLDAEQANTLESGTATLASAIGSLPGFDEITEAVVRAFEQTLGLTLRLMEAGEEEDRIAGELVDSFAVAPDC